jgi:hypothetical protein
LIYRVLLLQVSQGRVEPDPAAAAEYEEEEEEEEDTAFDAAVMLAGAFTSYRTAARYYVHDEDSRRQGR